MINHSKINSFFINHWGLFQVAIGESDNLVFEDGREFRKLTDEEIALLRELDNDSSIVLQVEKDCNEHRWHNDNSEATLVFNGKDYFVISSNKCDPKTETWCDESDVGFDPYFSIIKLDKEPEKITKYKY